MRFLTDLFLAWRYLKPKRNAVSVITCVSLLGVVLGVAVLIIVLAVMTGFTDEFKKKILETSADIQITDYSKGFIPDPGRIIRKVEKIGSRAAPVVQKHVLVQRSDRFLPKMLIGIVPELEADCIKVSDALTYGVENVSFEGAFSIGRGEALLSEVVANELALRLGDKIILHSPTKLAQMVSVDGSGQVDMANVEKIYLPSEFTVVALFSFGKYDFDKNVLFINMDDADELFGLPWGAATAVYVKTQDAFNLKGELKALREEFPSLHVLSWQQMNQQFLGVLEVEKNMQFFLLIFIVLVAAFSIANTLITVVVQKTREIGLLKALGAGDGTVLLVFLCQGFLVGVVGTGLGTAMGLLVIQWRNEILKLLRYVSGQEVFPKQFYLFSELPASVNPRDLVMIVCVSITLCTLGGLIPAWRAARLDPAKALRYE
ncbi:MAG: ABC transporter permease [Victivallales bacterium]|nr:ABC transporter permease [Victivallales bacterium]